MPLTKGMLGNAECVTVCGIYVITDKTYSHNTHLSSEVAGAWPSISNDRPLRSEDRAGFLHFHFAKLSSSDSSQSGF